MILFLLYNGEYICKNYCVCYKALRLSKLDDALNMVLAVAEVQVQLMIDSVVHNIKVRGFETNENITPIYGEEGKVQIEIVRALFFNVILSCSKVQQCFKYVQKKIGQGGVAYLEKLEQILDVKMKVGAEFAFTNSLIIVDIYSAIF